ncbi:MAG: anti-sigma factor [Gemmatimonadota bacterium]
MTPAELDSLRELAPGYALGALTPEETRAFEAALGQSPELGREVAELREVNALLNLRSGPKPSPALKQRLMASVRDEKVVVLPAPRPSSGLPLKIGLAASLLLAAGLAGWAWSLRQGVSERETAIADLRRALAASDAKLTARERTLNTVLMAEHDLSLVRLAAVGAQAPGIQFFWNKRSNEAIVHAFRLTPAPAGKVYQLWLMRDGKPIPSVTFNSSPDGHALVTSFELPPGGGFNAAAVTVEPTGGSLQPTTPVIMFGSVAGP